ncbi:MAG: hypothetical protein K2O67_02700, partial [Clostridia bacterium]|nr:hypothetical protein [Clostridia bacterium]
MKKRNGKAFKKILGAAAVATSLLIGMTAACSSSGDDNKDDENSTPSKLDTQVIKNGNFEFYDNGKGLYPISTPDSWSYSTSGNSSASMSGVIDTSKKGWDYLTDESLPATLEATDDLESDDENKKNYNGALTDDMLYANTHDAVKSDATSEDKAYISNPFTHKYALDDDGKVIDAEGNAVTTYADEDGKLFLDEALEKPVETSILMLHNYRSESDYKGTESYYKSSTTVTLEASTACKISVWVKTDNLYFDGATNSRTEATSERGAYIKLSTQVGGNSIDDVVIRNINTQQLLKTDDENAKPANNGWVQYTLYVEASTFASTTVNVTLGLGESGVYTVEGYAFFDDLEYTKYKNSAEMLADNPDFESKKNEGNTNVTQPLAPDADTKFRVDKVTYQTNNTDGSLEPVVKEYNSADRHFYVDFTKSSNDPDNWDLNGSITAGLTVDKTSQGNFVSVLPDDLVSDTITTKKFGSDYYKSVNLPTALKTNGLNVKDDLITVVPITDDADWKFKDGYKYNDTLTKALKSAATLPGTNGSTDAFVIVSADGAAYEAHIQDDKFKLDCKDDKKDKYALVSFWMKPSEIKSGNAVSVNVVDVDDDDNKGSSFGLSTASITPVNIGDEKDIYDGWVQCFVRVANTSKEDKQFKIVVNFGNTSISGTSKTSYNAGWVAISNVSVMNLDEDVYGYTSGGSFTTTLSFTEDTQKGTHVFDTA